MNMHFPRLALGNQKANTRDQRSRYAHRQSRRQPSLCLEALEPRVLLSGVDQLPDFIVWESEANGYVHGWTIDTAEIPGSTLLRLSTATANIGDGPLELRGGAVQPNDTQDVLQRIYDDQGGFRDELAGTFIRHPEHGHIHYEDYTQYNLREVTAGQGVGAIIAGGAKTSFCLVDSLSYDLGLPGVPSTAQYVACEEDVGTVIQGLSIGWADVYHKALPDQWIDVTGIADDEYWLEVVVDPLDNLLESNETNNSTMILIDFTSQPTDDHGNDSSSATATSVSSTVTGALEVATDVDWFSFAATAGVEYVLETSFGSLNDSFLRVFDTNGTTELASDDDDGEALASRIDWQAPSTDTYFLEVSGVGVAGGATGTYSLSIEEAIVGGEIRGLKWNDLDADATYDPGQGESGLENWTIYLDMNANSAYDPIQTQTFNSTDTPLAIPDISVTTSDLIISGFTASVANVNVTLDITHERNDELDVFLISPTGTRVELFSSVGGHDENFTSTLFDDEATTPIASGSVPYTGGFRPQEMLGMFDGGDPNGTWQLEVTDHANPNATEHGHSGTLNSWSLELSVGDPIDVTDASGNYAVTNLAPGLYRVREVNQPGWLQTAGNYILGLSSGLVVSDRDFGNHGNLTVSTVVDENDADYSAGDLSLREAITLAAIDVNSNLINFDPNLISGGPATLTLTSGELSIDSDLQIQGLGADMLTLSGGGASRVLQVLAATTVEILAISIADGSVSGDGAGVLNAGDLTLDSVTVSNNEAITANGGGVFNSSLLMVTGATFEGDNSATQGGAVFNSGTAELVNVSVSGNSATDDGGGIYSSGTLQLRNGTVSDNRADLSAQGFLGGGVFVSAGTATLHNSIVAGNFQDIGTTANDVNGAFDALSSNNLIGLIDGSTNLDGTGAIFGNGTPLDPRLGSLVNNGGTTKTHALLPGSGAIDAGDIALALDPDSVTLTVDQRGHSRVEDGDSDETATVDMGAFELLAGDFNNDELTDAVDIDALRNNILAMISDPFYDVNFTDGDVPNAADFDHMVRTILATEYGDVTLDQSIDQTDVDDSKANFANGSAGWAMGNFNLDTIVDVGDVVLLRSNFGFMPPPASPAQSGSPPAPSSSPSTAPDLLTNDMLSQGSTSSPMRSSGASARMPAMPAPDSDQLTEMPTVTFETADNDSDTSRPGSYRDVIDSIVLEDTIDDALFSDPTLIMLPHLMG